MDCEKLYVSGDVLSSVMYRVLMLCVWWCEGLCALLLCVGVIVVWLCVFVGDGDSAPEGMNAAAVHVAFAMGVVMGVAGVVVVVVLSSLVSVLKALAARAWF